MRRTVLAMNVAAALVVAFAAAVPLAGAQERFFFPDRGRMAETLAPSGTPSGVQLDGADEETVMEINEWSEGEPPGRLIFEIEYFNVGKKPVLTREEKRRRRKARQRAREQRAREQQRRQQTIGQGTSEFLEVNTEAQFTPSEFSTDKDLGILRRDAAAARRPYTVRDGGVAAAVDTDPRIVPVGDCTPTDDFKNTYDEDQRDGIECYIFDGWTYYTDANFQNAVFRATGSPIYTGKKDNDNDENVGRGEKTTELERQFIKHYGDPYDHAGHIRARSMGGLRSPYNLWPQGVVSNTMASWRQAEIRVEIALRKAQCRAAGAIHIDIEFDFPGERAYGGLYPHRPIRGVYSIMVTDAECADATGWTRDQWYHYPFWSSYCGAKRE